MLTRLRARYSDRGGNGEAWAFVSHVRNAAGFESSRTIDALAMALWPSRGLTLHGFEIKCSRADWLRELREPAKADAFAGLVDRWWLAVADADIVAAGELPDGWGLLVAKGSGLRCVREASRLRPEGPGAARALPPTFGRSFLAALLRSACRTAAATPAEIQEAVEVAREQERSTAAGDLEQWRSSAQELRAAADAFQRETGIPFSSWTSEDDAARIGRIVRLVLQGDTIVERLERRLEGLHRDAVHLAETIAGELASFERSVST